MAEHGEDLNRRLAPQSAKPPVDLSGSKRRTWEGYADDYRSLSERLVEMSARHDALLDAQGALERELAEKDRAIERLKARRVKDLDRLAEMARTRDSLERRASAQMAKVAVAIAKLGEKERQIAALQQGVGGVLANVPISLAPAVVPANDSVQEGPPPQSDLDLAKASTFAPKGPWARFILNRWWQQTTRYGQQAYQSGALTHAATLFRLALQARETPSLWAKLGHVLREIRQFGAADQAYGRVLQLEPGDGEIWFLSGYCAEMAGRKELAIQRYEHALALEAGLATKYDHLRGFHARLLG